LPLLSAKVGGCARPAQKRAISEIQRLGGKFEIDERAPHRPLVMVDLSFTQATDASLEHFIELNDLQELHLCGTEVTDAGLEHLKGLSNLKTLNLWRCKSFTDSGLAHLKGMTSLRTLSLWNTQTTDAGLVHVKALDGLQRLDLSHTQITDAGLEQLKDLDSLQDLEFVGCERLSDAGIDCLKKALPKVEVVRPR